MVSNLIPFNHDSRNIARLFGQNMEYYWLLEVINMNLMRQTIPGQTLTALTKNALVISRNFKYWQPVRVLLIINITQYAHN